jgi:hypothetical protein
MNSFKSSHMAHHLHRYNRRGTLNFMKPCFSISCWWIRSYKGDTNTVSWSHIGNCEDLPGSMLFFFVLDQIPNPSIVSGLLWRRPCDSIHLHPCWSHMSPQNHTKPLVSMSWRRQDWSWTLGLSPWRRALGRTPCNSAHNGSKALMWISKAITSNSCRLAQANQVAPPSTLASPMST